jgi:ribonucleoside-diphosphate reductase beta chain
MNSKNTPVATEKNGKLQLIKTTPVMKASLISDKKTSHVSTKIKTGKARLPEILLDPDEKRYVILPIKYPDIWAMYEKHQKTRWIPAEVDYSADVCDWEKLNPGEKHFLKHILAFFAASDAIVNDNIIDNLLQKIQILEARYFYGTQVEMENIHSLTYALLIDTYISDPKEKEEMFNAVEHMKTVKKKAEWAIKWTNSDADLDSLFIAFAAVEGIFFSGSFCAIFWLATRGLMPSLCISNDLISRDEGIHTDFAVLMHTNYVANKLSQDEVYMIFSEAVEIECEFITGALGCDLIGMNKKLMKQYIKFVANRLLRQLNYETLYKDVNKVDVKNPFPFMDRILLENKTNFFENRVTNYQKSCRVSKKAVSTNDLFSADC